MLVGDNKVILSMQERVLGVVEIGVELSDLRCERGDEFQVNSRGQKCIGKANNVFVSGQSELEVRIFKFQTEPAFRIPSRPKTCRNTGNLFSKASEHC